MEYTPQALIPAVDSRMAAGLETLYKMLSQDWKEVRGECSETAEQVAKQFGLLYVEGGFRLDVPLRMGEKNLIEDHAWCVDGVQRIVDLTATQFNPGLYNKLPMGVLIIGKEDLLFSRYRPGKVLKF